VLRAFYLLEQCPNTIVRTSWNGGSKVHGFNSERRRGLGGSVSGEACSQKLVDDHFEWLPGAP
jgi:hypothetical protein